jgi:hypothetical protein
MWKVDPAKMCRQHLLGEHVEMHMFVGTLSKGKNLSGYINGGLVDISYIVTRHMELAAEMFRRGYKHKSPLFLPKILPLSLSFEDYDRSLIDIEANEAELRRRCKNCQF